MKNRLLLSFVAVLLTSCGQNSTHSSILVRDMSALNTAIEEATPGSEIVLANGIWKDAQIDFYAKGTEARPITLRAEKAGEANSPAFQLLPNGRLKLENLSLSGQHNQMAFAPLAENMSAAYKLFVDNCVIENFSYVLKASKGSFADSIGFRHSRIQECENGFVLAVDEKGDYNAEMVSFEQCEFTNVHRNVIHFYRDGYDESTIGGFLTLSGNSFTGCGRHEASAVLLKTRGIINVLIEDNTFRNNPVTFVALLWGVKNNHHYDNTIIQSGQIKVEEQQKLEILY